MTTCQTCNELPEHDPNLIRKCKIIKSGQKQCQYKCKNKQKIKNINRTLGYVRCKCWPSDTDNRCHWRLFGSNMAVDKVFTKNDLQAKNFETL